MRVELQPTTIACATGSPPRPRTSFPRGSMDTVDIVGLLAPVTYFAFLVTEKIWPAPATP